MKARRWRFGWARALGTGLAVVVIVAGAAAAMSGRSTGTPGPAGYAEINADGTIYVDDSGQYRGVPRAENIRQGNITHPSPGVYCLGRLSFDPRSAVVAGANGGDANFTLATVDINAPGQLIGCGPKDTVRIRTIDVRTTALTDERFFVWLDDPPAA
jgi:hypothetical protein